jgi:hypothetical protein
LLFQAKQILRSRLPKAFTFTCRTPGPRSAAATVGKIAAKPPALAPDLATLPEQRIGSGGHVVDTLAASLWCLLSTASYSEAVLKAVNLGEDADTTGIAAGGLAGVCYGFHAVPERWRSGLARAEDLEALFECFAGICPAGCRALRY